MERTDLNENHIGKMFHEVHTESTAALLEKQYRKVLVNNTAIIFEDLYITPDGRLLNIENKLSPLFQDSR